MEWNDRPPGGTLLCVPTYSDWTLSFDDLVASVKAAQEEGYWPHDLAQALLRLEPTDPSRAAELDGLTLPHHLSVHPAAGVPRAGTVDDIKTLRGRTSAGIADIRRALAAADGDCAKAEWLLRNRDAWAAQEHRGDYPDGVGLIRAWVTAGGITVPEAAFDELGDTVLPDLVLPVVVPGVAAAARFYGNNLAPPLWGTSTGPLMVAPLAIEYVLAFGRHTRRSCVCGTDHWSLKSDNRTPGATDHSHGARDIAAAHGPFGRATFAYLAMNFSHAHAWTVDDVIALIKQGRFDPEAFVEASRHLHALPPEVQTGFSLARFATACDEVAQAGALHGIWPVLTAMAVTAVTSPKLPPGTFDILCVANKHVPTVVRHLPPDEVVPAEVRAFAASTSKAKAALEARAWLDQAATA
ncbi:MAG: hypothetical protein FWE61_07020 [Micrococcales bacterium]|nr:hypothetical protein [Micrococcales bacterium]